MIRFSEERCTFEVASLHNFFFFFTLNFLQSKSKTKPPNSYTQINDQVEPLRELV